MLISPIPLVDFYKSCLTSANERGFILAGCLIARDYRSKELYSNLFDSWTDLHSLSGNKIILMFAGHENKEKYIDFYISQVNDNQLADISFTRTPSLPYHTAFEKDVTALAEKNSIARRHTLEIESLKDFFKISEKELPCFVFTSLENKQSFVMPIRNVTFYDFFETLFIELEPSLNDLTILKKKIKEIKKEKRELETKVNDSKSRLGRYGNISDVLTDLQNAISDSNFENMGDLRDIQRKLSKYINAFEVTGFLKSNLVRLNSVTSEIEACCLSIDEAVSSICTILNKCKNKLS